MAQQELKVKVVTNIYGDEVEINEANQKVYEFSNKERKITYNAEIVENGKLTGFYTDYIEEGIVEDIETKLQAHGNVARLAYAAAVDFNQPVNDPERKLWNKFVQEIKDNQEKYFTKTGDWRKRVKVKNFDVVIEDEK